MGGMTAVTSLFAFVGSIDRLIAVSAQEAHFPRTCRFSRCFFSRMAWPLFIVARWLFLSFCSQELEENVEYKEKEDEFDVVMVVDSGDPEGHQRQADKEQEEEATVCIEAIDTVSAAEPARPDQCTTRSLLFLSPLLVQGGVGG